ncbi:MFS transporter [Paraburkholderia silviterrae]|uniref:MFS transporter n=1 Tax=Paraburkholderia silviterrae TaxID=2528715 RepID=A0A4V2ZYN9_9BURK|nr:MFS transporter [Paraburkholderia silviterrae]TDG21304.1 MFS transporter [Paraburkholderia silviterrae]
MPPSTVPLATTDASPSLGDPYSAREADTTFRKITWRLLPFLFVSFVVSQIDRTNIAFAKLQFMHDLGLNDAAYGLGASMFLLGYILFEVPSNLYIQKVGARATLMRIMLLWGIASVAMSTVRTPMGLYVMRFLLGVAEAGFFPGVMLYLSQWFPDARRGRITSVFLMSVVLSGMVGGPLAGYIMTAFAGAHGLAGWQVLFVYEGLPAIALGVVAYFVLADSPEQAAWLTPRERAIVADALRQKRSQATPGHGLRLALRDPRVYIAGFVYFAIFAGLNTLGYWLPSVLREIAASDLVTVGLLSTIPYCVSLIAMYACSRHSDSRRERRWHIAVALCVAAGGFAFVAHGDGSRVPVMLSLTCAMAASFSALSVFWTIPPVYLTGPTVASGIAMISSIGGVAAFLSPILVGWVKTRTGSFSLAFDALAVLLLAGTVVLLRGIPAHALRETSRSGSPGQG